MVKKTKEQFLKEAKEVHGNKYDYSLVDYVNNSSKVKIICPIHGVFEQSPSHHINGQNCRKCSVKTTHDKQRKSTEKFIKEARNVHQNKYDYSISEYKSLNTNIKIICPIHGIFEQIPYNHLKGKGCKYCGGTAKMDTKLYITKSKETFGDLYDYEKCDYINGKHKTIITCKKHGDFSVYPSNHITKKQGCPYCVNKTFDTRSFVLKSKEKYGDKFSYNKTEFKSIHDECVITCDNHGDIVITPIYHLNSECGCYNCCNNFSKPQEEIKNFIESFGFEVLMNKRNVIKDYELDIYIPSHNLAIEFNGLYWHSENFKPKEYHLNKTELCEKIGVDLLHIFEDEWDDKKEIVLSMLKHKLKITENVIYARNCVIKEVAPKEYRCFLNKNHIQGYANSKYKIGLYHNNDLVSLITLGHRGILKNKECEIIRFCNKLNTSVIGSFSKLLKFFLKNFKYEKIITYSDRRFSKGDLYEKNGFKFKHNTEIGFYYINNKKRDSRFRYQKHKLIKMGYDNDKTADQILSDIGIIKIFDCGNKKWEFYNSKTTKSVDCNAANVTI
jgi:hypothetical protein